MKKIRIKGTIEGYDVRNELIHFSLLDEDEGIKLQRTPIKAEAILEVIPYGEQREEEQEENGKEDSRVEDED